MQRPNQAKEREIMSAAARLFATRRFDEVRLDDVAAAARVGKGTLYVYFRGKEDLFLRLVRDGFATLLDSLRARLDDRNLSAWEQLEAIVDGFVGFATSFPYLFQLLRSGVLPPLDPALQEYRRTLASSVERTIRSGVRSGEFTDPRPALTAQFVLSFVRGAVLYGPALDRRALRTHLLLILGNGIRHPGRKAPAAAARARVRQKARRA